MTSSRGHVVLPLKMVIRQRRHVTLACCVVLWLSVLCSLQYLIITSTLAEHGTLRFG